MDKVSLASHLGIPSNIPEAQFEKLLFNQMVTNSACAELLKLKNWSPAIVLALAQSGQLKAALTDLSCTCNASFITPEQGNINKFCTHHQRYERENRILAAALRCSQSSLIDALEETKRLRVNLADCEMRRESSIREGKQLHDRIRLAEEHAREMQVALTESERGRELADQKQNELSDRVSELEQEVIALRSAIAPQRPRCDTSTGCRVDPASAAAQRRSEDAEQAGLGGRGGVRGVNEGLVLSDALAGLALDECRRPANDVDRQRCVLLLSRVSPTRVELGGVGGIQDLGQGL